MKLFSLTVMMLSLSASAFAAGPVPNLLKCTVEHIAGDDGSNPDQKPAYREKFVLSLPPAKDGRGGRKEIVSRTIPGVTAALGLGIAIRKERAVGYSLSLILSDEARHVSVADLYDLYFTPTEENPRAVNPFSFRRVYNLGQHSLDRLVFDCEVNGPKS